MRRTVARLLTVLLLLGGVGVAAAPAAHAGGCDTVYYSNGWSQRCWGFSGSYRITATCQPYDLARRYVVVGEWRRFGGNGYSTARCHAGASFIEGSLQFG